MRLHIGETAGSHLSGFAGDRQCRLSINEMKRHRSGCGMSGEFVACSEGKEYNLYVAVIVESLGRQSLRWDFDFIPQVG